VINYKLYKPANATLRGDKFLAKISDEGVKSQPFFILLSVLLTSITQNIQLTLQHTNNLFEVELA
jgi:hypothetical protein